MKTSMPPNLAVRKLQSHTAKISQDMPVPSDELDVPVSQELEVEQVTNV